MSDALADLSPASVEAFASGLDKLLDAELKRCPASARAAGTPILPTLFLPCCPKAGTTFLYHCVTTAFNQRSHRLQWSMKRGKQQQQQQLPRRVVSLISGGREAPGVTGVVKEPFFFDQRTSRYAPNATEAVARLSGPPLPSCMWSSEAGSMASRGRELANRAFGRKLAHRLFRNVDNPEPLHMWQPPLPAALRAALDRFWGGLDERLQAFCARAGARCYSLRPFYNLHHPPKGAANVSAADVVRWRRRARASFATALPRASVGGREGRGRGEPVDARSRLVTIDFTSARRTSN
jgi:hypothetical protein